MGKDVCQRSQLAGCRDQCECEVPQRTISFWSGTGRSHPAKLILDKGKPEKTQGRKATGPRFLRDAACDATKDPRSPGYRCYRFLEGRSMNSIFMFVRMGFLVIAMSLCTSCGGNGGSASDRQPPPPQRTWYKDADGDGYSDGMSVLAANRPAGHYLASELTATNGDCNDSEASAHPGGTEIDADGIDQDCNGFEISGPEEVVYDWTTDRCGDWDIPNFPARAFVDSSGQVQLFFSYNGPRRLIGPDLNSLTRDCRFVMQSHRDNNPAMFNDEEWIGATYTEDGQTIYAIIHNAWHACSSMECWYNGLTLAVSTDGGLSYQHPVAPPLHVVAASSLQYPAGAGPHGIFHPSSIVKGNDGYYYAMVNRIRNPQPDVGEGWTCLIRTPDLADPDAWRFWNGRAYDGMIVNPYTDAVVDPSEHDCTAIDYDDIQDLTHSLTYSEYLGRYILVAHSFDPASGAHGFFISYSDDLVDWTHRELVLEKDLPWSVQDPNAPFYAVPSLLDPESSSRNFETVGKTAYVYYMRNNRGSGGLDHDMLRIPIEFFNP